MRRLIVSILVLIAILFVHTAAHADEIYLKNNDRISGIISAESEEAVSLETEAMGGVSIKRELIERVVKAESGKTDEETEETRDITWQRDISASYGLTRGNTENDQLAISLFINRRQTHVNEITLKANSFWSATNKDTETEKYYGMARYAFSFGDKKSWYNFYKLEAERDRFAEIDYRLIPAAGIGYWFYDLLAIKLMAELAIGVEHTKYRSQDEYNNEILLVPRAFLEKSLFVNSKLIQDVTLYPSLTDMGEFRLHSETTFTNPITDRLSVNFSIIEDYNSDPPAEAEENDLRFISSLSYSF